MTSRRNFLKLGALFVPVVAAPTVAYSFLRPALSEAQFITELQRTVAAQLQIPVHILFGSVVIDGRRMSVPRERAALTQYGFVWTQELQQ